MKYVLILSMTCFLACGDDAQDAAEHANRDTVPVIDTRNDAGLSQASTSPFTAVMKEMVNAMAATQPTGDADHDFATMMIKHHDGAVKLAEVELNNGKDSTLKKMAKQITETSRRDIKALQNFIKDHQPSRRNEFAKRAVLMMNRSAANAVNMSGDVDKDFTAAMVRHHEDGVHLAREYMTESQAAVVRKIAENIVANNPAEIKKLEATAKKSAQPAVANVDTP